MSRIELTQINLFPIKSCRGISLEGIGLDRRGLVQDRRWMLVNDQGQFVTQRQYSKMSLINTQMTEEQIVVSYPGMESLALPQQVENGQEVQVRVWEDNCLALKADHEINQWFSQALEQDLRLVYMPDSTERRVDPDYAQESDITSFSDGFPLLLISEASLEDLNDRLEEPLTMSRFRPNLVVRGCPAYAEDSWKRIRIGDIEFDVVKPCSRCIVTTINPDTGERSVNSEPLRTLSLYRKRGNKVYFGQNLIHRGMGKLETGAGIEVLEQA